MKSVKTVLKQLQQSIQTVTSAGWPSDEEMVPSNVADNFQWLTKDHLCILVYLVTVMHSMQVSGFCKKNIWIYLLRYIHNTYLGDKVSVKKKETLFWRCCSIHFSQLNFHYSCTYMILITYMVFFINIVTLLCLCIDIT